MNKIKFVGSFSDISSVPPIVLKMSVLLDPIVFQLIILSSSGPVPGPGPFLVISISLLFSPIQTRQTGPGGDVIFTVSPPTLKLF